jgi:hypothetical protein
MALDAWNSAYDIVVKNLSAAHPSRLTIAIYFASFHSDFLRNLEEACRVAQEALGSASAVESALLSEEQQQDSKELQRELKGKMSLWMAEQGHFSV